MNILFVMKHRANAGNTHAVANYIRVAPKFGHKVAMYGNPHPHLPELKFSREFGKFDHIAYLFESEIYRLSPLQEAAMLGAIPKRDRLIFDMDGMYNPVIQLDGYDFNHASQAEQIRWKEYFEALSDRVMKPTLSAPQAPNVEAMPFYGYDPALEIYPANVPAKKYDILHIAHNWWRWRDIGGKLLPAIEPIRDQIGDIKFIGLWWDGPPAEGPEAGPEAAFQSDPAAFKRLRIQTGDSVLYTEIIRTMSMAKVNIFTQRPVLHHLKHLTLKYFEIFYADTIPLLMLEPDFAVEVYGPAARELVLDGDISGKLLDALARPDHYKSLVLQVRAHLAKHYPYERRMAELVGAFEQARK